MNDDALKKLWREQPIQSQAQKAGEAQIKIMNQKMRELDKAIRRRDLRENAAGLFVIGCFGLYLLMDLSTLSRIGCVVTMLSAAFTMAYPFWCKRQSAKGSPNTALMEFLEADLQKIDIEIRLLRSILWWYILPLCAGANLFYIGQHESLPSKVAFAAFSTLFSAAVWGINQRAMKKQLLPLKEELECLLKSE